MIGGGGGGSRFHTDEFCTSSIIINLVFPSHSAKQCCFFQGKRIRKSKSIQTLIKIRKMNNSFFLACNYISVTFTQALVYFYKYFYQFMAKNYFLVISNQFQKTNEKNKEATKLKGGGSISLKKLEHYSCFIKHKVAINI